MRIIEKLIVLISLIPLTQFFRSTLTGLGGGITDSLSSNALSMGAGLVTGALSGIFANKMGGSAKGGSVLNKGENSRVSTATPQDITFSSKRATNTMSKNSNNSVDSMKGTIPNAQIKGFSKAQRGANKAMQKAKELAPGVGKALKNTGKIVAGAGISLGGVATGNKALATAGGGLAFMGVEGASKQISDKIGSFKNKSDDNHFEAQDEGYLYNQETDDANLMKYHGRKLNEDVGIEDVVNINNNGRQGVGFQIDGSFDDKGNFRSDNEFLQNNSDNLEAMYSAFKNGDTEAIRYYNSQGIQSCSDLNGKTIIGLNNNSGILGASKNGQGNYILKKDKRQDFSNKKYFSIPPMPNKNSHKNYGKKNNSEII